MNTRNDRNEIKRRAINIAAAAVAGCLGSAALSSGATAQYYMRAGYAPMLYSMPVAYSLPMGYFSSQLAYDRGYAAYGNYYGREGWMWRASRIIDGGAR